jgi:hypothetical protein
MTIPTIRLLIAIAPCLLVPGCASLAAPAADLYGGMIAVVVENRSRSTVVAHMARAGEPAERLGRVQAMSRSVFYLHRGRLGTENVLYTTPGSAAPPVSTVPVRLRPHSTVPFSSLGVREIRWVLLDGEPYARVSMR